MKLATESLTVRGFGCRCVPLAIRLVLGLCCSPAFAQPGQLLGPAAQSKMQDANLKPALPGALQGVGIDQRLDQQVPLDLMFKDEAGRDVPLSSFFKRGKPVILAPVYYRCPMLCTQILNGLASSLKAVSLDPGQGFRSRRRQLRSQGHAGDRRQQEADVPAALRPANTANGWHLLTGDQANIKALTDAVGYHYKYDAATDQFAHASGIMVLTPEGRLSRYFYGVEYAPRDVRLGLVEASQNKIGTAGRPDSAVLLPLRPGHGQVRRRGDEHGALCRRGFHAGLRRVSVHFPAARFAP